MDAQSVQRLHDYASERQRDGLQAMATGAAIVATWQLLENQERQIDLQEKSVREQRITNLLLQGYRMVDIERVFAAEAAEEAAWQAAQHARNWALVRAAIAVFLMMVAAGTLIQMAEGEVESGLGAWLWMAPGAWCLMATMARAVRWLKQENVPAAAHNQHDNELETAPLPQGTPHQDWVEAWQQDQARRLQRGRRR